MIPVEIGAALLVALYAFADRFTGGGFPKIDAVLPGRSLFWGALLCGVVGWFAFGMAGALLALVWGVYRSLPWKTLGGRTDPREAGEAPGVIARHAILVPAVAVIGWQFLAGPILPAIAAVGYALAATSLAFAYGQAMAKREAAGEPEGAENTYVEFGRGAAYGAMAAFVLV